jgi:ubiquinone/menaquinone biosynthesis C-methylase UbiE
MSYRGICARTYDLLITTDEIGDFDFYRDAIHRFGQPALELGCGSGRLLVPYVREGLEVDGVDVSTEMLEICRRKLFEQGLQAQLFEQAMQALSLDRKYRTIFVPAASIMLLAVEEAKQALVRFREHLEPGGAVLIPLILPDEEDFAVDAAPEGEWRLRRENLDLETGAHVQCWELAHYDFPNQTKYVQCRYEVVHSDHRREEQQYRLRLRWYSQDEFRRMLAEAGFSEATVLRGHTLEAAEPEDSFFTFVAGFR